MKGLISGRRGDDLEISLILDDGGKVDWNLCQTYLFRCTQLLALTSGRVVNFRVLKPSKSGALISKCPKPLAVGIYERCRRELNYLTDKERRKL